MNSASVATDASPARPRTRKSLVAVIALVGLCTLLPADHADAQWQRAAPENHWQWTNDRGETKFSQYELTPIVTIGGGIRSFYIDDPDGVPVELAEMP